jgi:hypothetical protein
MSYRVALGLRTNTPLIGGSFPFNLRPFSVQPFESTSSPANTSNMGQYLSTETPMTLFPEPLPDLPLADKAFRPPSIEDTPMGDVNSYFQRLTQTEILEYCLGFDRTDAPALAEHVVLVALKCSTMDQEPYPMLAIGLHTLRREDMRKHLDNPGPHSANILRNISYHNLRMSHTASYANRLPNPMDIETNRFGATRFVSMKEAREVLEDALMQPKDSRPGPQQLEYCPFTDEYLPKPIRFCPVVLLNYDTPQCELLQDTFGFRPSIWQNVVATISTHDIAQEQGFDWRDTPLTLDQLTKDIKMEYPHLPSPADHAAYTLIDAVQIIIRPKIPVARESIRSVINTTMLHSQCNIPSWGEENFCTRCGENDHQRPRCRAEPELACGKCFKDGRYEFMFTHNVVVCPWRGTC